MTTKEDVRTRVHHLVDELGDEAQLRSALDHLEWLLADEEEISDEEMEAARKGLAEIERGESISLDDLLRKLGE